MRTAFTAITSYGLMDSNYNGKLVFFFITFSI
jgi:dUTPase